MNSVRQARRSGHVSSFGFQRLTITVYIVGWWYVRMYCIAHSMDQKVNTNYHHIKTWIYGTPLFGNFPKVHICVYTSVYRSNYTKFFFVFLFYIVLLALSISSCQGNLMKTCSNEATTGGISKNCIEKNTPSPWLTRIRLTRISLTRIFKKFPFLT